MASTEDGGDRAGASAAVRATPPTETHVEALERLAPDTVLAGRYRILETAGVGGMGVVYRARDQELNLDVAVKVLRSDLALDPQIVERFRGEIVSARKVSHRNVVRIHDIGEHGGLRFLTMTYVPGRSLREILEREGKLPLERALAITRQVADALAEAHEKGIVHRDLKPGNILIDPDGNAFIADFGIARSLERSGLTRAGAVIGTPEYLAPEQISGDPVDGRTDLYALGIVLYEMLSGKLPFRGESHAETLAERLAGQARDLKETGVKAPSWVRELLRRCLARQPARRYATARALIEDLDARERSRRAPRLPLPAAALGLTILLAAGLGFWLLGRPRARPSRPVGATPSARHIVAVLPLADQTAEPSLSWTSTGMAEMLAGSLAEDPNLRVLDSLRVLAGARDLRIDPARLDERTLKELRELWGADTLVTGVVRRAGQRLRVELTVNQADAAGVRPPRRLSAEAEKPEALFGLLAALNADLRRALGEPSSARSAVAAAAAPTSSVDAARAFEEGRKFLSVGDDLGAARAFERAVQADPRFAEALERLAEAYQSLGHHGQAVAAAEKALAAAGPGPSPLVYRVRARAALLSGHPAEAEKVYRQLLASYPNLTEARLDLANAQSAQGHSAEAVVTLQTLVAVDPNDPRAWFQLGKNTILTGESTKAIKDYLVRALALQAQLSNDKGRADVLNAIGVAYQQTGDNARALENYTAASDLRRRLGDDRGLASTLRNRALVENALGRSRDAEADWGAARRLFEKIGNAAGVADVDNDFGVLHEGRGEYRKALSYYQAALKVRRGLGDERLLAQSYDNVGYIYYLQGEYDNALVYWQPALEARRKTGEKGGVVLSEQNLGFLQIAQGKWDEATRSFAGALEESRRIEFASAEAISLGNLGVLHHRRGRDAAALASLADALTVARRIDAQPTLAEFTIREGEVLLDLGRLEEASARIASAEPLVRKTDNAEQAADLEVLRGRRLLAGGDTATARAAFGRARTLAAKSGSRAAILAARIAAARVEGDRAALRSALSEADSLGHALLTLDASLALAEAELDRGRPRAALEPIQKAIALGERIGWTEGLYRLYALRGRALEAQGSAGPAADAYAKSAAEVRKLRENVPAQMQGSFDALPLVEEIGKRKTENGKRGNAP